MRLILSGGGTGGHIYPALSVAAELADAELLYAGSEDGPEAEMVPRAGIAFYGLPARKLERRGGLRWIGASFQLLRGAVQAVALLRRFRPHAVLGTGGYACTGVFAAAAMLRIPIVIHEANSTPGRVNRLFGRFCRTAAVTFQESCRYFPSGRCVVTGMPVRRDVAHGDAEAARSRYGLDAERPLLLVSGGSGGARSLNSATLQALPLLQGLRLQLLHQTGRTHLDEVRAAAPEAGDIRYLPLGYIEEMPSLLAASSLAVCRAGSSTLAELLLAGVPAIAVPYPYAMDDHQTANALALQRAGAVRLVPDGELTGERLAAEVRSLFESPQQLENMRAAARAAARPDAAAEVARLLREAASGSSRPGEMRP